MSKKQYDRATLMMRKRTDREARENRCANEAFRLSELVTELRTEKRQLVADLERCKQYLKLARLERDAERNERITLENKPNEWKQRFLGLVRSIEHRKSKR